MLAAALVPARLENVVAVCGREHNAALTQQGEVVCWVLTTIVNVTSRGI
jgi:alpha-tubulin suppressor-like RCC1 family protein